MKKLFKILVILMLTLSVCACSKQEELTDVGNSEEPEDIQVVGGWTEKDEEMTEELQEIFDKATAMLVGAKYEAIKLIGTQVVAGTNYKFLADVTTVTETPITETKVVVIYKDLDGNCSVTSVEDLEAEATPVEIPMLGGWTEQDKEMDNELTAIFLSATDELVGANYEAVKLVGTQVVAGTNYKFLANITMVTAEPVTKQCYVIIYQDLEGNCSVSNIEDIAE